MLAMSTSSVVSPSSHSAKVLRRSESSKGSSSTFFCCLIRVSAKCRGGCMKSERLLLRDTRSLTFDASSFKMAETLLIEREDSPKDNRKRVNAEEFSSCERQDSHFDQRFFLPKFPSSKSWVSFTTAGLVERMWHCSHLYQEVVYSLE